MESYQYDLPLEAIAQTPAAPRDSARLLVDRGSTRQPDHKRVRDLPELLRPGDLLVVNDTKVIPARLRLRKPTGGAAEVLLLEPLRDLTELGWWSALVKPSRRLRDGTVLASEIDPALQVALGGRLDGRDSTGQRLVRVCFDSEPVATAADAMRLLAAVGEAPLPPYIAPAGTSTNAELRDQSQARELADYQTIYARQPGSVAAPTAGLHFTPELMTALAAREIGWATVDLVVGLDTFRPISGELSDHVMHTERYQVPPETWQRCQDADRVVAVGTTSVRALESVARTQLRGDIQFEGRTDLFLKPGDEFHVVDVLLTNFHLPRSTLLMLVNAFIGSRWRGFYESALQQGYRFLSFGDAMLLQRHLR